MRKQVQMLRLTCLLTGIVLTSMGCVSQPQVSPTKPTLNSVYAFGDEMCMSNQDAASLAKYIIDLERVTK